jgi:hypothetical protein
MTELKDNLGPYFLETALAVDGTDESCYVLDVARNAKGDVVASLQHVVEQVDDYLINMYDRPTPVTKLYVVGEWKPTPAKKGEEETDLPEEQKRYANEVRDISVGRDQQGGRVCNMPRR